MEARTGISYFGNRNPRHLIIDLEEIISHHCTFVLHTFSENDQLFYEGNMGEFVELSHGAGLQVYFDPWGVGRVFGGEAFSHFALQHRDACQILLSGELAPAACLNNPKFVDFIMKWVDDALKLGADVIFWQEPHFYHDPNDKSSGKRWGCICESCQKKYTIFYGEKFTPAASDDFFRFREDAMVDFLATLCAYVKTKSGQNAICLAPNQGKAAGIEDWEKVARIPELDILATNPYWIFFNRGLEYVDDNVQRIVQLTKKYDIEAQVWIQNFRIPKGREPEFLEAIAIAYASGIRNFAAWSFYGTAAMSYIACDQPKVVWDLLGEVYSKIRSGEWE